MFSALAIADFNNFSIISEDAFGVNLTIAKASSTFFPLIKSATILTVRDKKSFHSHSLENDYHTTRPKNTKNSLKTLRNFSLKMVNSKKLKKTKNIKNKNDIIRNKILGKNKEIINIQQILNRTKYKKNSRHGNKNNIPRNDNDNSLKYLLFRRIGKSNSANKKSSKTRKSYSRIKV